jgi:hypothetical protein
MIKKILISLMLTFTLLTGGGLAMAKSDVAVTVQKCKDGGFEFIAFLKATAGFNGFDGMLEYWKDFLRNNCHAFDLYSLDDQQDAVKKSIQSAFLKCESNKVPELENQYNKLEAEIYYVRNLTKVSVVNETLTLGIVNTGLEDLTLNDDDFIKDLMTNKKNFDDRIEDFDKFFESLTVKYSDRKYQYIKCEESGWEEVVEKFKEFIDNLGGLKEGAEAVADIVEEEADRFDNATNFPKGGLGGFVKNSFAIKVNNLPAEKGLSDIAGDIEAQDFWSSYGEQRESSAILNAAGKARTEREALIDRTALEAKYSALYKSTTDASTKEFLKAVDSLQFYINEGIASLRNVFSCVDTMIEKQCPK